MVFMSSAIVYGDSAPAGQGEPIDFSTPPSPDNAYGESKLQAEQGINDLCDSGFSVAILRCPMIFGAGCRGNFPKLVEYATKLPLFPDIENRRSMLYIGNLAELVAQVISHQFNGLILPQNNEYSRTSHLVSQIAELQNKDIYLTKAFNWLINGIMRNNVLCKKAFGDLYYEQACSNCGLDYRRYSLIESLKYTLGV